jgi:hypothetical protein
MKFEDLVAAITKARSAWELAQLPLETMKEGLGDLEARLQALEGKRPAAPRPGDA